MYVSSKVIMACPGATTMVQHQPNEVFQVKAFFNAVPKRDFLEVLQHFSEGISRSYNEIYCIDRAPGQIADGIAFGVVEDEVVLSNKDFLVQLEKECAAYLQDTPQNYNEVQQLLVKIKARFEVVSQ